MKSLHIISFDVPYPANYGGVIDVFYKIKQLHKAGVKIILHCFEYGRGVQEELNKYCAEVHYYKRKKSIASQISTLPFIVKSRMSENLMKNLLKDNHPILFEGLHTCGILNDARITKRFKIYRESNIEHEYYKHLAAAEKNVLKKNYFLAEASRLKRFEKVLEHADKMLVVSMADKDYLKKQFPNSNIEYLPSFHPYEETISKPGVGSYILYHGNLSIAENVLGIQYLSEHVFSKCSHQVIVAGLNPDNELKLFLKKYPTIELIENPNDGEMQELISNAQINCLYTHQATGLKLKLLNSLFAGRFCLVNDKMLHGTGLEKACEIANSTAEFIVTINKLMVKPFTDSDIKSRKELLHNYYVPENAAKIKQLLQ